MWKYTLILVCLLLTGCTEPENLYAPDNAQLASKIQKYAEKQKAVKEANVYIVDNYMVVALEISAWQRYRKGKTEQSISEYLKKHYPNYQRVVSADRKLHFELAKLPLKSEPDTAKRLEKLQKLLQEET